jgi:RNA polymerase sigma factor (sigma-70 family)
MIERPDHTEPQAHRESEDARDWALIAKIGEGDRTAFERLYKRYFQYLFRFIYQLTRRFDMVEDVINEVMLVVWQKASTTIPLARASTWILGIAHHKALQAMTKSGVVYGSDENHRGVENHDEGTAHDVLEADDLFARALRHLAPEHRAVLELVYHHELHYNEIALILGVPENTVKTRVFHARRKLREHWPTLVGTLPPNALYNED